MRDSIRDPGSVRRSGNNDEGPGIGKLPPVTLPPGTRLGPYEILTHAGSGGMGDVYKARDTRLDRTVALKVLPPQFAANPDLRARFEREARAVSSLDHPNICVLHDVGREGDVDFLVMQYLEGETLAHRLARGPLPLRETLRIGIEIASALDRAHRAGILHRDLKPGNVMLTKSGAKLLDFGLAKHAVSAESGAQTIPATVTSPLTGQGTILGTLLYMSPEQLEAREVDARSDIFSFGAMLYEMVTGVRPFEGKSQASIIAAVLEREPPSIAERAPLTPPALDRVVRKCLAKDPDHRWQSARDLGDELSWIAQGSGIQATPSVGVQQTRRRLTMFRVALVTLAVVALALTAVALWRALRQPPASVIARRLSLTLPDGLSFDTAGFAVGFAVSPDGKVMALVARSVTRDAGGGPIAGPRRIYLHRVDSDTVEPIPGTNDALAPFFSPDGLWIGYFTPRALMKVSVLGGTPVHVTDTPPVTRGGTWGPGGTIVFAPTQSSSLFKVPADGTAPPVQVSTASEAQLFPEFLPGGRYVLFTRRRGTSRNLDAADLIIHDMQTGDERVVVAGGHHGRYSPTGHIVFARGTALLAVPFDLQKREAAGTPLPIVDGIAVDPRTGVLAFAVAPDGTLYTMRGGFSNRPTSVVWTDRSGKPLGAPLASGRNFMGPALSPDGRRATLTSLTTEGDSDIYMLDVGGRSMARFSNDPADDFASTWTPDGGSVIYTSSAIGQLPKLFSRPADGSGAVARVVEMDGPQFAGSVSSSGILAFTGFGEKGATKGDIYTVALTGDRTPRPFVSSTAEEFGPEFSPDGKWIAYVLTEEGSRDVYVAPYPGPGPKRKISNGGGLSPAWCRSCGELYYQTTAGMMAVTVGKDGFGQPRVLFSTDPFRTGGREDGPRHYDVAPDGRRFLMIREDAGETRSVRLDVIIDWVSRLTERARPGS